MKLVLRKIKKIVYWTIAVFLLLIMLDITILAFPQPFFSHKVEYGNFTFYSDREFTAELDSAVQEVDRRLKQIEIYDPALKLRAFLCQSPKLYRLFARLTFVPPAVPGFNLSLLDNSFISIPGIEERYYRNDGFPKYSAIGGALAQNIGHELVHDYAVEFAGFFNNRNLPAWKTEGYAEYGASIGASKYDSAAVLQRRVESLRDWPFDARGREYYSWALTVEFLVEKRDLNFGEIMSDSITLENAYNQMMAWSERDENRPRKSL